MPDPQITPPTTQTPQPPAGDFTPVHLKDGTTLNLKGKNLPLDEVNRRITAFRASQGSKVTKPTTAPVTPAAPAVAQSKPAVAPPNTAPPTTASGFQGGVASSFGLHFPQQDNPDSLGYKEMGKQLSQQFGNAAMDSIKRWGPLAPADMLAGGIDGMASALEKGGHDIFKGLIHLDPKTGTYGAGEVLGAIGQILGSMEATDVGKGPLTATAKGLAKVPGDAATIAKNVPTIFSSAKMMDKISDYVDAKGLDIAKQIKTAKDAVNTEVARHTSVLQNAIPKDAIDLTKQLADAKTALSDLVKTPQKDPRFVQQMADYIKAHPPGNTDFETAKQFRSVIGAAQAVAEGPTAAALARIYKDATNKMSAAAEQAEAEFSWEKYNTIKSQLEQNYGSILNDITERTDNTGKAIAGHLLKDQAVTKNLVNNLAKYGLNANEVNKFIKISKNVVDTEKSLGRTVRSMLFSNAISAATVVGGMTVGIPFRESLAPAVAAGYASVLLRRAKNILEMDPKIIERGRKMREVPGPSPVGPIQSPPTAGATPAAGGSPSGGTPPTPTSPASKLTPLTPEQNAALRAKATPQATPVSPAPANTAPTTAPGTPVQPTAAPDSAGPSSSVESPIDKVKTAAKKQATKQKATLEKGPENPPEVKASGEPTVTKVPEGQRGEMRRAKGGQTASIAQKAKDVERKSAQREESKRTAIKEAQEAIASKPSRAQTIEETPNVEIEDELKSLGPGGKVVHDALQKARKSKKWDDDTYRGYLIEATTNAIQAAMKKANEGPKE